jgi:hypothetical protein
MEFNAANAVASFPAACAKIVSSRAGNLHILYAENPGAPAPDDSRFATPIASSTAARHRVAVWSRPITMSGETIDFDGPLR